jgi:DNA-binding CsgD family transcriptional regulator
MPTSVRGAVLARTSQVPPHDFEVLQLVATAPDRLDDRVLPALGVDPPTLRRLDETALLTRSTADRHRVALRQEGNVTAPRRPRVSTSAYPAGLTNRQLDVARLVAGGHSNAEIASRLYISPKTADHHVSAILTKLALPNRRAVAMQAAELGLA